jgi:hypothetical protein
MRNEEGIENAEMLITTHLMFEERMSKCVAVDIIQRGCNVSRRTAKGYLIRLIRLGYFEDVWYDICLPKDKRQKTDISENGVERA